MAAKKLLVTGATGKQGGALIEALLKDHASDFSIYGLTRSASSASAKKLAAKNVTMIEGDMNNPSPIFEQLGHDTWGVFSVSIPGKTEESKAKNLIDASLAAGVQHFVYASVDRGGPERSETDTTRIPHFIAKFNAEKYLQAQAAAKGNQMSWTILRPVAFYDNLTPNFFGRCFGQFVLQMGGKKLQLVGTKDIGKVAAQIFLDPEKYKGKGITLAGDELNFQELNQIFKEEMGYDIPLSYGFIASLLKWLISDLGFMFKWFEDVGYGGDIQQLKAEFPFMQDFRTWLRSGNSKFEKKS
jgi:uncharacterized protein YbjT (DUF2867 family)